MVPSKEGTSVLYNYSQNKIFFLEKDITDLIKEKGLSDPSTLNILGSSARINENIGCDGLERKLFCEIVDNCNLKCNHCYGSFCPSSTDRNSLTNEQWKEVLTYFNEQEFGVVQFTGGEPLLRKDELVELVESAYGLDFKGIEIFSNCTLFEEELMGDLERFQDKLKIRCSIYSTEEEIHDSITNYPGSYTQTLNNLIKLKEKGFDLETITILMEENKESLKEIQELMKSLDISHSYDLVKPIGRGKQNYSVIEDLKKNYSTLRDDEDGSIVVRKPDAELSEKYNSCFYKTASITSSGDLYPCIFSRDILLGNVIKDGLSTTNEALLENAERFAHKNIEGCGDCELRYACNDCRPLVHSLTDDWFSKSPLCPKETGMINV